MRPSKRLAGQQNAQSVNVVSATKGINAVQSLARMGEEDCVYCFNILPEDYGMEVRDGYVEWANGWTGGIARTVITFEGNVNAEDRLWVANDQGIWEVTAQGTTAPVQVATWPSSTGDAGICSFINFTNDGNARFVLLCDGENGYYTWEQATNTWTKILEGNGPGNINGTDPNDFNFITVWKERIWFVQKESANAWYMEFSGTNTGKVFSFNFGAQFRFGGPLRSLHNWTLDGGDGIDDYLVALSGAGDAIVYRGTDPSSSDSFSLVGSWYLGELPAGNRIATEFSGELYILSVYGLQSMSKILNGSGIGDPSTYITNRIAPYIRSVLDATINEFGWHVHIHPKQSLLWINSPPNPGLPQRAFTLYTGSESWGLVENLPKSDTANWKGDVFWTDIGKNKIYIQRGGVDAVYLDPDADGPPQAIDWQVLGSYSTLGSPGQFKRVHYIRPMFVGTGTPSFTVKALYDYDVSDISKIPSFVGLTTENWDSTAALWGVAQWQGGLEAYEKPRGATGWGRSVAINIRGRSAEPTTLIAYDVVFDNGGIM